MKAEFAAMPRGWKQILRDSAAGDEKVMRDSRGNEDALYCNAVVAAALAERIRRQFLSNPSFMTRKCRAAASNVDCIHCN